MANTGPKSATTRSESSTKESPAVVKEIPKQSSKDVKANSRYQPGKYGLNVATARVPASQLPVGRSRMAMLRKGERTEEGRPTPREIYLASAGIRGARAKANRGWVKNPDPIIERLRIRKNPVLTRRQRDIEWRSNPGYQFARQHALNDAKKTGNYNNVPGNDASRNVNLRGGGWENRRK